MDWNWSAECEEAFIKVKKNIIEAPLIIYFNPDKELVLQVDSSKDGLGAALLSDEKPIEYASRAPTSVEQNWAQIEKETLAVVFGLEHFDQYTCGRKVVIENDHKPLTGKAKIAQQRRMQELAQKLIFHLEKNFSFAFGD